MYANLACPDCGFTHFSAQHPATITRYYVVPDDGHASWFEEVVADIDRDFDSLKCDGCGQEWQEQELVPEGEDE